MHASRMEPLTSATVGPSSLDIARERYLAVHVKEAGGEHGRGLDVQERGSPESVDTLIELILLGCPASLAAM
jgi:hypothetical protein